MLGDEMCRATFRDASLHCSAQSLQHWLSYGARGAPELARLGAAAQSTRAAAGSAAGPEGGGRRVAVTPQGVITAEHVAEVEV